MLPDSNPRRDRETAPLGVGAKDWGHRIPNALLPGPLDLCNTPLRLVSSSLRGSKDREPHYRTVEGVSYFFRVG